MINRWVFFPFLFVYFSPTFYCSSEDETSDRPMKTQLLLNDPNLMNSRIEALERELQSVKSKLLEQETKTQDLQIKLDNKDTRGRFLLIQCALFSNNHSHGG